MMKIFCENRLIHENSFLKDIKDIQILNENKIYSKLNYLKKKKE